MLEYEDILGMLHNTPETLVLTANNRQARALIDSLHQSQKAIVLAYPPIFSFDGFIQDWFAQAQLTGKLDMALSLITPSELWLLFDKRLKERQLPQAANLATELVGAFGIAEQYELSLTSPAFEQNEQTQLFASLAQDVKTQYQARNKRSRVDFILSAIDKKITIPYKKVIWFGFDTLTPIQSTLKRFFADAGIVQEMHSLIGPYQHTTAYAFDTVDTELKTALAWAVEQMQAQKKVALVIPSLAQQLDKIEDFLAKTLPDEYYGISMGRPLSQFGIIQAALTLLHQAGRVYDSKAFRVLCKSPFIKGSITNKISRGELSLHPKLFREGPIDKTLLKNILAKTDKHLSEMLLELPACPSYGNSVAWHDYCYAVLKVMGFPGDAPLTSESMQCLMQLQNSLQEFKQYGALCETLSKSEAFALLEYLLTNRVFQTQKAKAPIEILGLLEASGLQFDAMWIMGLDADCLPKPCKPNPFLPLNLQRQQETPYTLPQKEHRLAQGMLQRFLSLHPTAIVSYAQTNDNGHVEPSPLLGDIRPFESQNHTVATIAAPATKEALLEDFLLPPEVPLTRMSSGLLEQQANCPFQAFASGRLAANIESQPEEPLSKRDKGALLHKALEFFWRRVENQQALLALDSDAKLSLIQESVARACQGLASTTHAFLHQTEETYLVQLLQKLLAFEEERPSFKVHAMEHSQDLALNGVCFHLRIDRIDMGIRQKPIVIDYKTSIPSKLPWKEERPRKPQMLLYALTDNAIDCLFFLGLENGVWVCSGVASKEAAFHPSLHIVADFAGERQRWQERLEALIAEYKAGLATPDPIDKQTCGYCAYKSLCRYPLSQHAVDEL